MKQGTSLKHLQPIAPDQSIQDAHRESISRAHIAEQKNSTQLQEARRRAQAPFQTAMLELVKSRASLPPLSMAKLEVGGVEERRKHALTDHTALKPRSTPAGPNYTGWATPNSPNTLSNFAWGQYSGNSVYIEVGAGMQELQGGSASEWGYVGQYFKTRDPGLDFGEEISVIASVDVGYAPAWTTTNIWPFSWDYASLNLTINLICLVYDLNWTHQFTVSTTPLTLYTTNSAAGSFNWTLPLPSTQVVPLSLDTVVAENSNLGIFVQCVASASAAGGSTGTLVPGSSAFAWLRARIQSWQVTAGAQVPA